MAFTRKTAGSITSSVRSLAIFVGALSLTPVVLCQKVIIDTSPARAALTALNDPSLTLDPALSVARLGGNRSMIKEMHDLGKADTEEQFVRALVAAAHNRPTTSRAEKGYAFRDVKKASQLETDLLDQIDHGIEKEVRDRISPCTPHPKRVSLKGFVVAAGDGGGYTFGGTDFYPNIARNDAIRVAKQTLVHEIFHGAQGAVYHDGTQHWVKERTEPTSLVRGKLCSNAAELFMELSNEGTAMFVGSESILKGATGATGQRMYAESQYGGAHLPDSADLLEVSIASLQAPDPVPFKTVYSVVFFGKGIVSYISRGMTSAVVEQDGPAGVQQVLQEFVLRYTRLKSYGKDSTHPLLGENTVYAAQLLHDVCSPS